MGGGGLYGESGTLTVSTDGISGNNGAMAGGGIYVGGGTVTLDYNKTLSDNRSESGSGGGIFLNGGTLKLQTGAALKGNRANQNGGGLYCNGGTLSMGSAISFRENKAENGNGGGICFAGSNDYTLLDANLTGNTAGGNGGAVFYDGGKGSLTLKNVKITGNHAAGQGGGACIDKSSAFNLNYATIKDNTCGEKADKRSAGSNLYLTGSAVIRSLNGTSEVYVGSATEVSAGFYVATLSGSNKPDLTYLHASDPAFLPDPTGVGRDLWGVVLVKAYSHVTVENGTIDGGNEYHSRGDIVKVTANSAPAGKTFDHWEAKSEGVTFADSTAPTTTFTMPSRDVTVTAIYTDLPRHTVTVEGDGTTGGGDYYEGATVIITAPAKQGETLSFEKWESKDVTIRDETATTTTFVMPDHAVTVTAKYQEVKTPITDVNLKVTKPEAGKLLEEPTLDSDNVTLQSHQWQGAEGTPVGGTATCNSQYLLMVTLKAAEGYQFSENVSVTFGGQPALSSTLSGGTLTAYYAFEKTGPDTVTAVTWPADLTIKQGETPSLPDRVSITTQFGTANAAQVTWDKTPVAAEQAGIVTYTATLVPPKGVSVPEKLGSKTITVTVKAPEPVGKITIGQKKNDNGTVTVTLSCATPDATIRYTVDDDPEKVYSGPFVLGSELLANYGSDVYVLHVTASAPGYADRKDFTTIEVVVPKPTYTVSITGGQVVNGGTDNKFTAGSLVAIKATPGTNQVFCGWTATGSVNLRDASASTTTFTMPNGNVTIEANFIDMLSNAALTMDAPTSGVSLTLPETATWGGSNFPVSWTTKESGENVLCTATITIPADLANGRYFASNVAATLNGDNVDAAVSDGSLTVTKTYTLKEPTGTLYSVTLCATIGNSGQTRVLGSYPADSTVTITAPEFEGFENYRFISWMAAVGDSSNQEIPLNSESATTSFNMPDENVSVIALYTPLVTGISLEIPAPEAGKPLAEYPSEVSITLSDNSTMKLTDEDTLEDFPISWDTTDETAVFGEQYTAIVFATDMIPMDDNMTVTVNGKPAQTSYETGDKGAYYVRTNDAVQVFNVFPAAPATMTGLTTPEDIHDIKPGTAYSDINLPGYVEVQTSCGTMAVRVTWSASGNTPNESYVDVKGTLAYPDALVHTGFPDTVTQRIYLDGEIPVPEKVATPTAVPNGTGVGEYENKVEVTLYCATPGAKIYYTLDGTTIPTADSTLYDGKPIPLIATTTIKAIAMKGEMTNSDVATFTYKVYQTYPVYYSYGKDTYLNGKYKKDDRVEVTATDLPGKTFKSWMAEGIELSEKDAAERTIKFKMPENKVTLTPQYDENSSIISALSFSVDRVVVGQKLPDKAAYTAEMSDGTAVSGSVNIAWSNADETAESGKTYTATITFTAADSRYFSGQPRLSVMSPERNTTACAALNNRRSVTVTFQCTAEQLKLKEIIYPETLTGLPNGTMLEDIQKQLVGQVKLVTENGTDEANVAWNLSSDSSYDSASGAEQSFTLTGTVTIPNNIDQNNVPDTVTVRVTVSAKGFVGAPMASVAAGRYSAAQSVALSSLTDGAAIYYTTDGTEPTEESTRYSEPIQVSTNTTLKAIAMKNGMSNSIVSTYVYTFRSSGGGQTNPGGQTKPGYANCSKGDTCPLAAFSDLVPTAWYHNGIHYCLDNGLMSGYGNGIFAPSDTFNRAMMVQVFYNMEKRPEQNSQSQLFDDVADGQWYTDAVGWASANGITIGYGKTFGPNDAVTREQVAQFLYNFARFKGYDTTARAALSTFTDGSSTSSWAQTAMQWAVGTGVLNGKGDGILDPAATATRAEVATMLTNFCEKAAK